MDGTLFNAKASAAGGINGPLDQLDLLKLDNSTVLRHWAKRYGQNMAIESPHRTLGLHLDNVIAA
jgi:hypothetical protein